MFALPILAEIGIDLGSAYFGAEVVSAVTTLATEGLTADTALGIATTALGATTTEEVIGIGVLNTAAGALTSVPEVEIASGLAAGLTEDTLVGNIGAEVISTPAFIEPGVSSVLETITGTTTIDVGEDGLITNLIDLRTSGVLDTIINQLNDAGIIEGELNSITWNQVLIAVTVGGISVDEVVKSLNTNLSEVTNGVIDAIIKGDTGMGSLKDLIVIGPDGNVIPIDEIYSGDVTFVNRYRIGVSTGKKLAGTVLEMTKNSNNLDHEQNLLISSLKVSLEHPEDAFVSKKLNQYLVSSDYMKDPIKGISTYEQIKSVYNGKFQSEPFIDSNGNPACYDETGKLYTYTGSKGVTNLFGYEIKNPTFHGEFCGPKSPNSTIPVDLGLDLISMFHDVEYERGYFDYAADLKLISRLENLLMTNPELFTGNVYYKARFTHLWFANVGPILSYVTGQQGADQEILDFANSDESDYYSFIFGNYDRQLTTDIPANHPARRAIRLIKQQGRDEFYAGVKEGLDQAYKEYSQKYLHQAEIEEFDNIRVISVH